MGRHPRKKPPRNKEAVKAKLNQIRKQRKLKLKEKRARLVVRNLPFDVTEENLREYFQQYGEIDDVKILKKEDGKLVGCAFIQFKLVQKARKAQYHTNGKPFLGRNLNVDFALAKNKYEEIKANQMEIKANQIEIKEEPKDSDEIITIKEEPVDENVARDDSIENVIEEIKSSDEDVSDSDNDDESIDEEEEEEGDDDGRIKLEEPKKPKFESHDVTEGKTVFVKNVPFMATNDDLKECMLQFGPIHYALICIDKLTEHSKGTAFVKFENKEDADKALNAGTELTLQGNILDCHRALDKSEIKRKNDEKLEEKTAPHDSRNLYLMKEGVILAGSKAADGVSAADMAKRLQLEQYKTQVLRNLNMFVSRERLVVHNLPPTWDDKKLRMLFKKYSPRGAVIKEARIMRDLNQLDANGVGKSKEFGFVTYKRHDDALSALRALNNNPNIFSANKRPIVSFSIENKTAIKTKQKRLEKSRLKNPKCKDYNPELIKTIEQKQLKEGIKKEKSIKNVIVDDDQDQSEFVGITAKPGPQKMRSKYKLSVQAKIHHENLKNKKKQQKFAKQKSTMVNKRRESMKQPKLKNKRKINDNDDNFAKIVNSYKQKLQAVPEAKRAKWFE